MQKVTLGRTGLQVSRIGFGSLFVSSFAAELEQAIRTVHGAVAMGIHYIDTAPTYGDSEEVTGKALAGLDQPVVLSTKIGGRPKPWRTLRGGDAPECAGRRAGPAAAGCAGAAGRDCGHGAVSALR